jgi:hypothetical protein
VIAEIDREDVMHQGTKKMDYGGEKTIMINLHPNWHEFIRQCEKLGYGEIYRIKIQDGLPMAAEVIKKRIRFSKNGAGPPS